MLGKQLLPLFAGLPQFLLAWEAIIAAIHSDEGPGSLLQLPPGLVLAENLPGPGWFAHRSLLEAGIMPEYIVPGEDDDEGAESRLTKYMQSTFRVGAGKGNSMGPAERMKCVRNAQLSNTGDGCSSKSRQLLKL